MGTRTGDIAYDLEYYVYWNDYFKLHTLGRVLPVLEPSSWPEGGGPILERLDALPYYLLSTDVLRPQLAEGGIHIYFPSASDNNGTTEISSRSFQLDLTGAAVKLAEEN